MDSAIVVFTAKSAERIINEGGSSSWRLDRNNARACKYCVCTRNSNADWVEGDEAHHSAFLIGRVADVVASPSRPERFLIKFSEFARIDVPEVWKGERNPIRYANLDELGIDVAKLHWQPMPDEDTLTPASSGAPQGRSVPFTLADAKKALSESFGVPIQNIEITIRG